MLKAIRIHHKIPLHLECHHSKIGLLSKIVYHALICCNQSSVYERFKSNLFEGKKQKQRKKNNCWLYVEKKICNANSYLLSACNIDDRCQWHAKYICIQRKMWQCNHKLWNLLWITISVRMFWGYIGVSEYCFAALHFRWIAYKSNNKQHKFCITNI